jgi:hypothetical protein
VGFEGGFSVGPENVDGLDDLLVYILDEFFDGLGEELALGSCECALVVCKITNSLAAFRLFEFARNCQMLSVDIGGARVSTPWRECGVKVAG